MNLMMAQRRGGKTTVIIRAMAALTDEQRANAVCFASGAVAARTMRRDAQRMYPDIDWTDDNFTTITVSDRRRGLPRGKIYIDEVENCLVALLGDRIEMATVTMREMDAVTLEGRR